MAGSTSAGSNADITALSDGATRQGVAGAGAPDAATTGLAKPSRRNLKLLLVILVCVAPVIASYLAYYAFPPSGRTNYGRLIEPQVTLGPLNAVDSLGRFKGQWILVLVQDGPCDRACAERLYFMRQTHTSLGRDRDRAEMVLLQSNGTPLSDELRKAHPYLQVVDADPTSIARWFPAGPEGQVSGHLYVVDPQHNLMMQFPFDPDPARTRKDLQRLMKASRIG